MKTDHLLRLGIYADCNQSCLMCNPKGIRNNNPKEILSDKDLKEILLAAFSLGIKDVHLTGGEPLLRKSLVKTLKEVYSGKENFIVTTNGTLIGKYAEKLKEVGLKRVNISLHSLNPERHSFLTQTEKKMFYEKIEGIKKAAKVIDLVKLNVVVMRDYNLDEIENFIKFCQENKIILRLMELVPYSISFKTEFFKRNFVSMGELKKILQDKFKKLIPVVVEGNNWACEYFKLPGLETPMGIDYHYSSGYFCPGASCRGIRISPSGLISACWTKTGEYPPHGSLKGLSFKNKKKLIETALNEKIDLEKGKLDYPAYHVPNYGLFRGNTKR